MILVHIFGFLCFLFAGALICADIYYVTKILWIVLTDYFNWIVSAFLMFILWPIAIAISFFIIKLPVLVAFGIGLACIINGGN